MSGVRVPPPLHLVESLVKLIGVAVIARAGRARGSDTGERWVSIDALTRPFRIPGRSRPGRGKENED